MSRISVAAVVVLGVAASVGCTRAEQISAPSVSASASPVVATPIASASPAREPLLAKDVTYAAKPLKRYVEMRHRLGDPSTLFAFDTQNPYMKLAPLLVTGARRDEEGEPWYRVLLPMKPNGVQAWVIGSDVRLEPRDQRIVVDLSERTLDRFVDGELENHFSVGVGTPAAPTATGTFYVWVRVRYSNPTNPYGIFALGLSGFSEVLSEWPGGGRMAIHGTAHPDDRGRRVSHGCVRVYNKDLRALKGVPLGTPVVIRP